MQNCRLGVQKLVCKVPSYFERRYRHASATGKACSKMEMSVHIFPRVSRIQESLKKDMHGALFELITEISEHGEEPIAPLP